MAGFSVDLQDPESIAKALARAQNLVEGAEERHRQAFEALERAAERESEATVEVERWRALAMTLENAGEIMAAAKLEPEPPAGGADESSKARVLHVVAAINTSTNIAEVSERLPDMNRKTVSWALWKLASEGAIQKLGHGRYAPASYRPGQPAASGRQILLDAALNSARKDTER